MQTAIVPSPFHALRLDAALALFLPEAGIRQRRRLFDTHVILLNGKPANKGTTVAEGDTITIKERELPQSTAEAKDPLPIIAHTEQFGAINKSGGLHSATIAGKATHSAEAQLPSLFPHVQAVLLNRLDQLTSGILLIGFSPESNMLFHQLENDGAVEKLYLAVVEGLVSGPLHIPNQLDTDNRKTTKVLDTPNPDILRHTAVLPLRPVECEDKLATLVLAVIHKGARHQIRAHLAHAGYPIVGDPLYGTSGKNGILYLHHYRVHMPIFTATCPPPWPQWKEWQEAAPER